MVFNKCYNACRRGPHFSVVHFCYFSHIITAHNETTHLTCQHGWGPTSFRCVYVGTSAYQRSSKSEQQEVCLFDKIQVQVVSHLSA